MTAGILSNFSVQIFWGKLLIKLCCLFNIRESLQGVFKRPIHINIRRLVLEFSRFSEPLLWRGVNQASENRCFLSNCFEDKYFKIRESLLSLANFSEHFCWGYMHLSLVQYLIQWICWNIRNFSVNCFEDINAVQHQGISPETLQPFFRAFVQNIKYV